MTVKSLQQLNRLRERAGHLLQRKWHRVVPKSVALMDHCKCRNYGTNTTNEAARRRSQHEK